MTTRHEAHAAAPTPASRRAPRRAAAALTALAAVATASPALADNHFILEVDAGLKTDLGVEDESGRAIGGTFGFGGRIPGTKPAYYFIGRIGAAEQSYTGAVSYGAPDLDCASTEWALGARMYLPITDRFRAMLQVSLGETYQYTDIRHDGRRPLRVDEELFSAFFDAGVQYRFTNHFSLGAVGNLTWHADDRADVVARSTGIDTDGQFAQMRLGITTTFHF